MWWDGHEHDVASGLSRIDPERLLKCAKTQKPNTKRSPGMKAGHQHGKSWDDRINRTMICNKGKKKKKKKKSLYTFNNIFRENNVWFT